MAKGIREFNKKLASLRNTLKMTKTMKMVSASKLRRAQMAQRSSQVYAQQVNHLIARLATSIEPGVHPLITPYEKPGKALVLVLTSDKGLCGAFNNGMIRFVSHSLRDLVGRFEHLHMSFCGRRGYAYFQKRQVVKTHYEGATHAPTFPEAAEIADDLMQLFQSGEYHEVYLAYNEFHNPLKQTPMLQKLLPLEANEFTQTPSDKPQDYIFEPAREQLLAELVPKIVRFKVFYALLENAAGEHGARMTAMDNATTNCQKMIGHYTLMRNRARQAAITTELIEIISGAEAL